MEAEMTDQETILIVDDNPANLDVLFEHLDEAGFKTIVAEDGEIALERAKRIQPDLILLDIMMPGLNGFETCRRLKRQAKTKDIPVIFITALADVESKVTGFEAGGVDYITKPFQQAEILARVTTHLTIHRLQNRLREQVAELDAFAHTVAHDLQSSVTTIMGFADIFIEEAAIISPQELERYSNIIARSGRKMRDIIDALLLLANVRKQKVKPEPLDMASIVAEAQERLRHMIETYQPEFVLPALSAWPTALGYAPWVEEIWANYLSNALKYGGDPPHIEVGATVQGEGLVRFWVRDNGPGLKAEDQARLFIPFTRLGQIRVEGHGLGLSIVQRIVERLGGQAGVESEGRPGQGSLFYFTLPGVIKKA